MKGPINCGPVIIQSMVIRGEGSHQTHIETRELTDKIKAYQSVDISMSMRKQSNNTRNASNRDWKSGGVRTTQSHYSHAFLTTNMSSNEP